jgi:hypothetical protein
VAEDAEDLKASWRDPCCTFKRYIATFAVVFVPLGALPTHLRELTWGVKVGVLFCETAGF